MQALDRGRPQSGDAISHHICIVTETYLPEINGVALTLGRLVEGLRNQGHIVTVVRPRRRSAEAEETAESVSQGVTVVGGVTLPGYHGVQLGLPAGSLLRRLWRLHRADVVYVATEGPLGLSAESGACGGGLSSHEARQPVGEARDGRRRSDAGCSPTATSGGETGLLTPLGNAQAFVQAAVSVAAEHAYARTIGLRARAYAAALDWPSVVDRFLAILLSPHDARERSAHAA